MESYPFDSQIMSKDYLDLFEKMIQNKDKYLKKEDPERRVHILEVRYLKLKEKKLIFINNTIQNFVKLI